MTFTSCQGLNYRYIWAYSSNLNIQLTIIYSLISVFHIGLLMCLGLSYWPSASPKANTTDLDTIMKPIWKTLINNSMIHTDHFCIRGPCTPPMPGTMMSIRFLWSILVTVSLGSTVVGVAWLSVGADISSHSGNTYCSCDNTSLASSRASKILSSSVSDK